MNEKYSLMKMPCEEVGRALACSSDNEQAEVLNSFGKELSVVCKDKDLSGLQPCYIADGLDYYGKMLVKSLSEFVDLREDANSNTKEKK